MAAFLSAELLQCIADFHPCDVKCFSLVCKKWANVLWNHNIFIQERANIDDQYTFINKLLGMLGSFPDLSQVYTVAFEGPYLPLRNSTLANCLTNALRGCTSLRYLQLRLTCSWPFLQCLMETIVCFPMEGLSLDIRWATLQQDQQLEYYNWIRSIAKIPSLRTLTLFIEVQHVALVNSFAETLIAAVQAVPQLCTLRLGLGIRNIARVLAALAPLGAVSHLEALTLALRGYVDPVDLAVLCRFNRLRRLRLELHVRTLSANAGRQLVSLAASRHLRCLQLWFSGFSDISLPPLQEFLNSPHIETLLLEFGGTTVVRCFFNDKPQPTPPEEGAPPLRTLSLEVACARGDDAVVRWVSSGLECIESLTLDLPGCLADVRDCTDLALLRFAPKLQRLQLEVRGSRVGADGARIFGSFGAAPSLRELHLGLASCGLGSAGARALAELRKSSSLQTLQLDLAGNAIASDGAEALASLGQAPRLERLTLLLANNGIGGEGADHLQRLRSERLSPGLTVDLAGNPADVWDPCIR